MRKLVLIIIVILISQNLMAQQRLAEQVVQRSENINRLIRENAGRLSQQELMRVSNLLQDIKEIIKRDGPTPPPPPIPDPVGRVAIRGDMEGIPFNFQVSSVRDLVDQCFSFLGSSGLAAVDDIKISINYSQLEAMHNSTDYWRTPENICSQVSGFVQSRISLPLGEYARYIIRGTIENKDDFVLRGDTQNELFNQCEGFIYQRNISAVDDIRMSINYGPERVIHNSTNYWRNSFEICQQIVVGF